METPAATLEELIYFKSEQIVSLSSLSTVKLVNCLELEMRASHAQASHTLDSRRYLVATADCSHNHDDLERHTGALRSLYTHMLSHPPCAPALVAIARSSH